MTPRLERFLGYLHKVHTNGQGHWSACCPSHDDRDPSLSITEKDDGRILVYCHAGCSIREILSAIGMELDDLLPDGPVTNTFIATPGWRSASDNFRDKVVLSLAEEARSRGERLSANEMRMERDAWLRQRG